MALSKTASVTGQLLLFDDVQVYVLTSTNQTDGALALAETTTSTNLTSSVLAHNPRIRILFAPKQPSPVIQGQPADAWAFPKLDLMTGSSGLLNSTYLKFVRRLVDGSGLDPASAFGLKVISSQLTNFNTTTQQPYSTPSQVRLEVVMGVASAANGALVTDLEVSRNYDFIAAPELPFEWYNFS